MILEKQTTEFDTNGVGEIIDFKIENSPKMFEAFSNFLYKDPVKAVSREISSNCYDANVAAGNEHIPVRLFLPGDFVAFQDNGPGISPEQMREIFCYLGRSSKTDSNLFLGAYGLGSKTPWALSSSFTVETVFDGIHYTYTAFKDTDFMPKIMLVDERKTSLPTGTTIKIPVENSERWRFKEELRFYTKFWKTPPEFVGYPQEKKLVPTMEADSWAIYLEDIGNCNVLFGGIPYVDTEFRIPRRVVLKFPIGSLDVSLSRDSLRYTDKTKLAIKTALEAYDREVVEKSQQSLNQLEDFGQVLNLIESLPKAHETRTWIWKGQSFQYPFAKPIVVYERPRRKLSSYHTSVVDSGITPNSVVTLDKDEVTSYDRQRIGSYLNVNKLNRVYLVEKDSDIPLRGIGLSTIKVARTPGVKGQKAQKLTIKGKSYNSSRQYDYKIDSPSVVVYHTEDHISGMWNFPVSVVKINPKDEKHILDEVNWITMDEYIQQEVYDKLTIDEIQAEVDRQAFMESYGSLSFLADDGDFVLFKSKVRDAKVTENAEKIISWLVSKTKLTPNVVDIYEKYPLLEHMRYIDRNDQKHVKEYIQLIKERDEKKSNANTKSHSLAIA